MRTGAKVSCNRLQACRSICVCLCIFTVYGLGVGQWRLPKSAANLEGGRRLLLHMSHQWICNGAGWSRRSRFLLLFYTREYEDAFCITKLKNVAITNWWTLIFGLLGENTINSVKIGSGEECVERIRWRKQAAANDLTNHGGDGFKNNNPAAGVIKWYPLNHYKSSTFSGFTLFRFLFTVARHPFSRFHRRSPPPL